MRAWWSYLARRALTALVVLWAVLSVTYALSRLSDADPVYRILGVGEESVGVAAEDGAYGRTARRLGLDIPSFYVAIVPAYLPDSMPRVLPLARRAQLASLLADGLPPDFAAEAQLAVWGTAADTLVPAARRRLRQARGVHEIDAAWAAAGAESLYAFGRYTSGPPGGQRLVWRGAPNGYTHFLGGLLRGELGYSLADGEAVADKLARALAVSLPIGLWALLVALTGGLALGLALARRGWVGVRGLAYALVAAPGFFLATFAVVALAGRGRPFPGPGWVEPGGGLAEWLAHAALPVLLLGLPAAAYLGLVLAESLDRGDLLPLRDFARLQGAGEGRVWWGEMLRLGVTPSVTAAVGQLVPAMVGGSVVVEYVFNLPGVGRLALASMLARDWPVVAGVVVVSAAATVIGYLVMDALNAWLDPRWRKLLGRVG